MNKKIKKLCIKIVLWIYLITNFFQSILYSWNKVYAARNQESQIDYTNIVAIIVDDNIYDDLKEDVQRYATKYIQWDWAIKYTSISNSKALVFPINVENFSAKNITQLLENIYFDWIIWEPSKLVWVVLIWDIPLPVVNQDWYIYPTIYPYVDFEEQKFIWDDESKYFVYNNNPNWQAEIWHWMINFEWNINEYKDYFNKLKQYRRNPKEYIWKAIWYDDFVWNKKYFTDNSLNFYLNNFLFAEDLWYHRYNDLMIKVLQWQRNKEIANIMEDLNEAYADLGSTGFEIWDLSVITEDSNTPTMQIKSLLDNWYLSKYSSLFWPKYLKVIKSNVETANRWTEIRTWSNWNQIYSDALDTHYTSAEILDETTLRMNWWVEPFLIMINNALQEAVDTKVENEKYRMNEVIPLTYLKYSWLARWLWKCVWDKYDAYENYFFWENAKYLQSMEDTSTYRWTYRNYIWIDSLTIQDIQNSQNPSTDIPDLDLNKKSIWWSYEIFATQVDANRWYNYNNSLEEYEVYSGNKTAKMENWDVTCVSKFLWICWKRRWSISHTHWSWCDLSEDGDQWWCESPQEYALRIWWWASPLNIEANWSEMTWKSWYNYTGATSRIFDIAWSTALWYPYKYEYESNSFESVDKYSNLTLRRFSPDTSWPKFKAWNPMKKDPATYWFWYDYSMDYEVKFTNKIPVFNRNSIIWWTDKSPKTANDVDYFEQYNSSARKEWNIIKIERFNNWGDLSCKWAWEIYTYKTLDSRVINDSVNEDELNWYEYEIFNDDRSHVKQFYSEMVQFIDAISWSVNEIVWNDTWSLRNNLTYIKDKVDEINSWFESIINFNLNQLWNFNTWQVVLLANSWKRVFNTDIVDDLSGKIKESQDLVLTLSWLVDVWPWLFDWFVDFVEDWILRFEVNWRDLIFLESWKNNIKTSIMSILDSYASLKSIISESFLVYETINEIWSEFSIWWMSFSSLNIVEKLTEIKENIWSQLNGSWCETKYESLCNSLDSLIGNYSQYAEYLNNEKNWINNLKIEELDDDWEPSGNYNTVNNIFMKLILHQVFTDINEGTLSEEIYASTVKYILTGNANLTWLVPWMNMTTSDRPIDSPRYMTFKWIGWDKVTFIYPDIYKAEIFSGNSNEWILSLKSTWEIATAIREYLRDVVVQYNKYLAEEVRKHTSYYNENSNAYDLLNTLDPLATPNHLWDSVRPYNMFSEDYLINWLETSIRNSVYFSGEDLARSDPIWFIADMIYYQNITWQTKTVSPTIQEDFDNQRTDYDVNEKISYILDNYLITDNNKWNFLTPNYRDNWYEVAFINSDWSDYISYEVTPPTIQSLQGISNNYASPVKPDEEQTLLEQQLLLECNIPEDWGVLLFQLSGWNFSSPWRDAVKCRFDVIRQKPFELKINFPFTRDTGSWFWNNVWNLFNPEEYEDIWSSYIQQLWLLNTSDINEEIIWNMDLTNPWDAAKLQDIVSYTMISMKNSTVTADNPNWEIDIYSSTQLWNIDFYITNVWTSKIKLLDGYNVISNNITMWTWWFNTWTITFDPYDQKTLNFEIDTPIDWLNVILFYMCLPWTHNLSNCVKSSLRLDVVPWEIKHVSLNLEDDTVLEGASVNFNVRWTDNFWNNVWELIAQKFEASASSWTLSLYGLTSENIKFSNFDKANFSLNAVWEDLDWKTISVQVSWLIAWEPWVKASWDVNVIKWRLDVYSGNIRLSSWSNIITWLSIKLPDENVYSITDQYNTLQVNSWELPKIQLKLVDKNWWLLDINWNISVKAKNNYLIPWKIPTKTLTKNINWQSIEVIQNSFSKTNSFFISGWTCTVYLLPNFYAWDEIITITMPWVDDIQLPVSINPASPKIVSLSADSDTLNANSSTRWSLKVFDNWNNLITDNVSIVLRSINDKISLSKSWTFILTWWNLDFDIYSYNKWWNWYLFAYMNNVPLSWQNPATLSLVVQTMQLPENDLNIMYLNLFGNDWWNQWWYMSNNNKHSETLIKNSDKLLAVTTQLLDFENIKYFPVIIDSWLQINNLLGTNIQLTLNSWFKFNVHSIWDILVSTNWFKLEKIALSENILEESIRTLMSGSYENKNIVFYVPEQLDSNIESNDVSNNAIYINNEKVFDITNSYFNNKLIIELGSEDIAWYQIRNVYFEWFFAWRLIFAVGKKEEISSIGLNSESLDYWIASTWINWSSNEYWLWFYKIDSELSKKTFGYPSIQDSGDPMLGIWFTADFKNITNFWWGMPVWESTIPFGSELLINIWDPLLKRIDENESAKIYESDGSIKEDTEFDLWLWEVIYSEPGKDIFKVINIDFNNDNLEDIIVVFKDWTIKILKNYWWTNPFENLWALMILADRISDVSIWDVDGNGYKDIIIRTEVWWLRVYLNNKWIFDVDWYPVCINANVNRWEISEHPEKVSWLHQIFLEDMDLDWALDIVTNDSLWFIKIFYWWTTNGYINYLSTNKYMCDDDWYNRIQENSKIVYQFWIKIDNSSHVLDQSLIHRKWLWQTEWSWISAEDVGINLDNFENIDLDNIDQLFGEISNFDISAAENAYKQDERLKKSWFEVIPVYETDIQYYSDVDYVEIWCLTWEDPVKIYKIYEDLNNNPIDSNLVDTTWALVNGDLVRVTVHIEANNNFRWTFIDNISGPWVIPTSEYDEDSFENFWFNSSYIQSWYITSGQIMTMAENIHWDLDNGRYMIDNIIMRRWDKLEFSYWLIYHNNPVMDIEIDTLTWSNFSQYIISWESLSWYLAYDNYPDISVQPEDWCNDSMFIFFNDWTRYSRPRQYTQKYIDLAKILNNYNNSSAQAWETAQNTVYNSLSNSASNWNAQDLWNQVWWLAGIMETLDWKWMLRDQWILENLSHIWDTVNLWSELINALTNDVVKDIDKVIWWMCNGIDLSSLWLWWQKWCWLPVPFNQAFLWVWDYHLFWCYNIEPLSRTLGKGMPILTIPGNWWPTMAWYIPAPWIFWYPFKGPTDSFFLWNYWWTYSSLFRVYLMPTLTLDLWIALCFGPYSVWSNIPDPVGSILWNCVVFSVPLPCWDTNDDNLWANATTEIPYEYTLLKWCNKQNIPCYVWNNESSTPFLLGASSSNNQTFHKAIPDGSFAWWFITIERKPETNSHYQEDNSFDVDAIILKWWANSKNKILWSNAKGLIEKIIKSWLDKQIKYMMNNLTNFKISIVWPDLEWIVGKGLTLNNISESITSTQDQKEKCEKNRWNWIDDPSLAASECWYWKSYCCKDTPASLKLKCENKWMKWDNSAQKCIAWDSALSNLETRSQNNLLSREQVSSRSEYANPLNNLADAFNETPLVNIHTRDITVDIPMLTTEDITSYISLSQSRMSRQWEILEDWKDFFTSLIWFCGWDTNINWIEGIEAAVTDLKQQYKEASACLDEEENTVENIQWKLNALENLKRQYNFSSIPEDYKIYEAVDWWFYIKTIYLENGQIIPYDVYLYFDPTTSSLAMFTKWFDLNITNSSGKKKISIKRNNETVSNIWLSIKQYNWSTCNSCKEIFLDWTVDVALNWFMNIQSNANTLMVSVKQNIETLQQYQQFPVQLYEWIHVSEKYLSEISSLMSSILGTLSMWMQTNANRYSQYVDAIITLMTTLETYQLIMDLSADWSENCSTCTNDNYDQFSCKLWLLCNNIDLPIVSIPPTKIPSLYLDFSEVHVETDVVLPNFKFNAVAVPLPDLPNIPEPPDIDLSLNLDESLQLWIDALKQIKSFNFGDLSLNIWWKLPLLPSPPVLPDLPSFIPTVEFELPLLPPAPKIPELPNKIKTAIKAAEIVWKILCIIKWKFWLVAESSIKAKVEQITQRDYEVAYWDNFDQTLSDWNKTITPGMSSVLANIFTWFSALLQTNDFKDAKLKWFDLSLQTYINLQYNFDDFYAFLQTVVNDINWFTYKISDYASYGTDYVSNLAKRYSDHLKACTNNMFSVECLWDSSAQEVNELNELLNKISRYKSLLDSWFSWLWQVLSDLENKRDELENLQKENQELQTELQSNWVLLNNYQSQLNSTSDETQRKLLLLQIENIEKDNTKILKKIEENILRINELQSEINDLNEEYWSSIQAYNELISLYNELKNQYSQIEEALLRRWKEIIDWINREIEQAWQSVNFNEMKLFDNAFWSWSQELETKKELERNNRSENLQNLYKEIGWTVSYVDYDPEINKNNFAILKDTLSEINEKTNNKEIKKKAKEYLSLIAMDRNISANNDSIVNVEKQYNSIINNYVEKNDEILDLIENNYDKFLVSVSNNDTSLVNNNSTDITLSAKLFDMDKNTILALNNWDNIVNKYMDYNLKNLQWYINALENNDASTLNMDEEVYTLNKSYLNSIKDLSDKVYGITNIGWDSSASNNYLSSIDESPILLAQNVWWNNNSSVWNQWNNNSAYSIDIANYIDWYTLNTEEWSFLLANTDYINKFQSKFLLTDINWDSHSDLIMWDNHNVYIKYRNNNSNYDNIDYDDASYFYVYKIESYEDLMEDSDDWIVSIRYWWIIPRYLKVKLVDTNWWVKNFKYSWQTFDSIKVSRLNSKNVWDKVDWYLVKMIHRVDQFNDKENLISQGNNSVLFDKKYVLVLPMWSEITWTNLETEEWTLNNIENWIWTGNKIFSLLQYNNSSDNINLTVKDLPRNWQYTEIYTLNFNGTTYEITSSSSNQVVAGPQIIADTEWPDPEIKLYRPAINDVVSQWTELEWYVWTNYILQMYWEDNVALDRIWIANELWETLVEQENISNKTWYIEYSWLYFTWAQNLSYYIGWVDIDWNQYVTDVTLNIKVPEINITNIIRWNQNINYINWNIIYDPMSQILPWVSANESFATIVASLDHDIDTWYVQFLRNRLGDKWEILTWKINWNNIVSFPVTPNNTGIYWWYFDFGDEIGLYSVSWDMVATLNPENWKITINPWFQNTISIKLDYSPNIPVIKVMEWDKTIFWIIYSSIELVSLNVENNNWLSVELLDDWSFWEFNWGQAVIMNWEVILYVSPIWQIYTEAALFWEYWFDDATNSVIYTFRTTPNGNWNNLWSVKIKIKSLLDY